MSTDKYDQIVNRLFSDRVSMVLMSVSITLGILRFETEILNNLSEIISNIIFLVVLVRLFLIYKGRILIKAIVSKKDTIILGVVVSLEIAVLVYRLVFPEADLLYINMAIVGISGVWLTYLATSIPTPAEEE